MQTIITRLFYGILISVLISGCELLQPQEPATPAPEPPQQTNKVAPPVKPVIRKKKLSAKDKMMRVALDMRGKPYLFQGESPKGFDASGLVFYCHQQVGLNIPRTFQKQLASSKKIAKEKVRPGDLLFFSLGTSKPTHVGIYLGVNKFIHAPPTSDNVIMSDIRTAVWKKALTSGGRL